MHHPFPDHTVHTLGPTLPTAIPLTSECIMLVCASVIKKTQNSLTGLKMLKHQLRHWQLRQLHVLSLT
jgi:hypothetical protein